MAKSGSLSKTAVWILLALLIVGLAGFGATNLSGTIRTIGSVGDKPISVESYGRALQQEIRSVQQQTGQALPFSQVREIGLDRAVLQRLVAARAIDHEASELGISVGDENVRDQVLQIPAFQGLDGSFDRDGYRFALEQAGLSEGEFETQLREETARNLLQSAVINGISMPDTYVETLVSFIGERRDFTWSVLSEADLETALPEPTDEDLRAYHSENQDRFTLPASKDITYAWLTPDMLLDDVTVDETDLRAAYDERLNEFVIPERRLVERLVYLDQERAPLQKL
jgi:peptidyl-prolyl cis-trans isomerase D